MESLATSDSADDRSRLTNTTEPNSSRHLASPFRKRNPITMALSERNNFLAPPTLRQAPSKSSLLSRFLRSITSRKIETKKERKPLPKPNPLRMKGAKVDREATKSFDEALEREIQEHVAAEKRTFGGEKINAKMRDIFRRNIYRDKTEKLYKVYRVRSSYMTNGESKPMLALLTDKTLYLTGIKSDRTYSNQFVIPYNELDVIMVSFE